VSFLLKARGSLIVESSINNKFGVMLNKSVGCFVVVFLLVFSLPIIGQIPVGTPKITQGGQEYYKYTVEKGIGLYRIAINFGVSQDDIIRANPSVAQGLVEGQTLLIPAGSAAPRKSNVTHTVEKGHTLFGISHKYAISIDALVAQNPTVKDGLYEGMVLTIPQGDDFNVKYNDGRTDTKGYRLHTVQPKETLYGISGKYNVSVDDVMADNPGLKETGLIAGAVIRLRNVVESTAAENRPDTTNKPLQEPVAVSLIHFHKVMAGENFHMLTRKYQVPYNELVAANPTVDAANLPIGVVVAIPVNPLENRELINSSWYLSHKVAKKETLYGISKKYNCSNDLIKLFNPTVDLGNLPKGKTLYFPSPEWKDASANYKGPQKVDVVEKEEQLWVNDCNGYNYASTKPLLNVVVLMPFNLKSLANQPSSETGSVSASSLSGRTKMVVEFYEGFLLGVNRWKEQGVNIRLVTIDTGTEPADIRKVLARKELKDANLIVGPAYPDHIRAVSEFSAANKIKMVLPFGTSSNVVYSNPYLFSSTSIDSLATESMAKHLVSQAANSNVLVVKSSAGSTDESSLLSALRRQQAAMGSQYKMELKEVLFSKASGTSITSFMSNDKNNIVVVPSTNEVSVGQVLIALDAIAERNQYPMEVYGTQEWLKFQTVDPESFHRMNGRLFTSHAIDYEKPETKKFVAEFRQVYSSEPVAFTPLFQPNVSATAYNRYGGLGFDVAYFFVGALVKYGPTFETCVAKMDNSALVQSSFKFNRVSNWGGFCNKGLFVLKFNRDLSTQRIVVE
jgi:LysM repeat protein/ABC-type branched-subunit amino acid transport system substrate-binding protein